MKKYLLLLWNKLSFLFLTFLSALIVIGLGIGILKKHEQIPKISIDFFSSSSNISITKLPSKTEENTPLPPLVSTQKESNSEDKLKLKNQSSDTLTKKEIYLGHFHYSENERQNLVKVADFYGREEFLDKVVANAFNRMKSDAKISGVELTLISGFRPIVQQEKLFLKQINKQGSKELAAKLSAPPGYSEHHTGYALDIGEGQNIDTFIKFEFENTKAYRWLEQNAYQYGFELSFPENNSQGVSYEPWHWRFVGSPRAQEIFKAAKNLI